MSARAERRGRSLHDRALGRLRADPTAVPPPRGYRLPDEPEPGEAPPWADVDGLVLGALTPLPADAATLLRRFALLGLTGLHTYRIAAVIARLPLSEDRLATARALGRQLTRTGTTRVGVGAGLALLARVGEPEDVPYLAVLGLYRDLGTLAVRALDVLDRRRSAALWLLFHTRRPELRPLVEALWREDGATARTELLAFPTDRLPSTAARRIAEAVRLAHLLREDPSDTDLLARAALLLARMGRSPDDPSDLLACADALALYGTVVTRADELPPTLDNAAVLLSLVQDLDTGTGVLLDWPPGRRAELLQALERLLAGPRWATVGAPDQRHRTAWFHRGRRRLAQRPAEPRRLRIQVVAGDPAEQARAETRILVDGRPVVPAVFGYGPGSPPDHLLTAGALRAREEPHEVQLAEAHCAEGCCGALQVTVRRDGEEVVWENWRHPRTLPGNQVPAPELPAYRFDAAEYDAEITRATADRSWTWPARTIARWIRTTLTNAPEILGRWDSKPGWINTNPDDPDTVVVMIWYRPSPEARPLRFRWLIPDDGTPSLDQVDAAVCRLTDHHPTTYARLDGYTREDAADLGYPWPDEA
ncbi:hypothetical protein [Kitasatospora sp. NPDC101183]|uniref:hypothetical protein n=1 Tax=Kitasatospora sp. NPDC101183 TaxID=3364100 RepID=UPI00381B3F9F